MSTLSKDSKIEDLRIDQDELLIKANLVAKTSEAPSLVSISGTLTATAISIDLKEPIRSCEKVQVVNRATGSNEAISAAPSVSGSVVSVTLNATGLTDVCIVVSFRK